MSTFKHVRSTEVNEIYTNLESHSESDSSDSSNNEESDGDDSSMQNRSWRASYFTPRSTEFTAEAGVNSEVLNLEDESPLEFFEAFFDQSILGQIANETNKYQTFSSTSVSGSSTSHQAPWSATNIPEIYVFLAVVMLMAHVKKNRIKDYWSTDQLIYTPIFTQIFTRHRFLSILKFLHFHDDQQRQIVYRLHKIKPVLDHLRKKFKLYMKPNKNLCIDESMLAWKGRLNFKRYIPSKRHRFGVKIFVLCN